MAYQFLRSPKLGEAEGEAKIVLGVRYVVGQAGMDIVHFQGTDAEALRQRYIDSASELRRMAVEKAAGF